MPKTHPLLLSAKRYATDATRFLQDLVRIPSVNSRDPELNVAQRVVEEAGRLDLPARLVAVEPDRPNVLVELGKGSAGFALLAHMDTVVEQSPALWSHPPFAAEIHDGVLYGRGAADNKAGIACGLYTLALLRDSGLLDPNATRVVLAGLADEESGACSPLGARYLLDQGLLDVSGAIYTYAGSNKIRIGHRGTLRFWIQVEADREVVHTGSRKWSQDRGKIINVCLVTGNMAVAVGELDISTPPHPAFPNLGCTVSVVDIECGEAENVVPRTGRIGVDVRLMPGQSSADVLAAITDIVDADARPGLKTEIVITADAPAACIEPDHHLVEVARRWTHTVTGKEWPAVGAGPTNEGYMFIERGIPTLCGFGATGNGAHAYDEYVEVASLPQTIAMYAGVIQDYLVG